MIIDDSQTTGGSFSRHHLKWGLHICSSWIWIPTAQFPQEEEIGYLSLYRIRLDFNMLLMSSELKKFHISPITLGHFYCCWTTYLLVHQALIILPNWRAMHFSLRMSGFIVNNNPAVNSPKRSLFDTEVNGWSCGVRNCGGIINIICYKVNWLDLPQSCVYPSTFIALKIGSRKWCLLHCWSLSPSTD